MFDGTLSAMKSVTLLLPLMLISGWFLSPLHAAEQRIMVVGAEFWAMPRHADQLLTQTPLKVAAQQLWVEPDAYLVLHYPDTESGEVWGLELQAWLVSLGISSDRVELRAGYERDDGVAVIVVASAVAEGDTALSDEQTVEQNSSVGGAVEVMPDVVQDEVELQ